MLVKEQVINSVEVNALAVVQVQVATTISDDGVALPTQFTRYCIVPGDDYSDEPEKVRGICAVVHTGEAITAYHAANTASAMEIAGAADGV